MLENERKKLLSIVNSISKEKNDFEKLQIESEKNLYIEKLK